MQDWIRLAHTVRFIPSDDLESQMLIEPESLVVVFVHIHLVDLFLADGISNSSLLKHKFIATTDVEPLEVNIKTIGHHMLSGDKYGYLLPFEAVSILLLACIVGGLLIARKR